MARFSLGREDYDGEEGSSNGSRPARKKQRTVISDTEDELEDIQRTSTFDTEGELEDNVGNQGGREEENGMSIVEEEEGDEIEEAGEGVEVEYSDEEEEAGRGTEAEMDRTSILVAEKTHHSSIIPNESISMILTDPDVLDCLICLEPLYSPVFQCENGHVACASCCTRIQNKCPSCSWPIGYNRCRAIERVLEALTVSCTNSKYGCVELVNYSKRHDHEMTCYWAPCSCPLHGCNYVGSCEQLYVHYGSEHPNSRKLFKFKCLFPILLEKGQRYLVLQEKNEGVIFILNHYIESLGSTVNMICIAPSSSKTVFSYELIARNDESFVKLWSSPESIPRWSAQRPVKNFLLVPNDFIASSGQLKLEMCIVKH